MELTSSHTPTKLTYVLLKYCVLHSCQCLQINQHYYLPMEDPSRNMVVLLEYHLPCKMNYQILLTTSSGIQRIAFHALSVRRTGFSLVLTAITLGTVHLTTNNLPCPHHPVAHTPHAFWLRIHVHKIHTTMKLQEKITSITTQIQWY